MNVDKIIQDFVLTPKIIRWRPCDGNERYQWYYAENNIYVINDAKTNAFWFVKAKSPISAWETVKEKIKEE